MLSLHSLHIKISSPFDIQCQRMPCTISRNTNLNIKCECTFIRDYRPKPRKGFIVINILKMLVSFSTQSSLSVYIKKKCDNFIHRYVFFIVYLLLDCNSVCQHWARIHHQKPPKHFTTMGGSTQIELPLLANLLYTLMLL